MSKLSDVLSENGLNAESVVARSKAIEKMSSADRDKRTLRETARRTKKTYEETNAEKPSAYGRGVTERNMGIAMAGGPVTRTVRKKITRAVNSLLTSAKKDAVDTKILFEDVPARKGKAAK